MKRSRIEKFRSRLPQIPSGGIPITAGCWTNSQGEVVEDAEASRITIEDDEDGNCSPEEVDEENPPTVSKEVTTNNTPTNGLNEVESLMPIGLCQQQHQGSMEEEDLGFRRMKERFLHLAEKSLVAYNRLTKHMASLQVSDARRKQAVESMRKYRRGMAEMVSSGIECLQSLEKPLPNEEDDYWE